MLKGILCVIIFLSCGVLGLFKAMNFSERFKDLQDISDMLQILETELTYKKDPLIQVFQRISQYKENCAMALLGECSLKLKENQNLNQCWETTVEQVYRSRHLTSEDLMILTDLGLQLGKTNIQGQNSMFSLANLKLEQQMKQALEEKRTKGKMYRSLGFSIGSIVAIILI